MSHLSQKMWHKKAKWLVKKLILKPPANSSQMRDLCSSVVERRLTSSQPKRNSLTNSNQNNNSMTLTKTIVGTALALWEDKDMVDALNKNQTFLIAKERIQRTASHLLPNNNSQFISSASAQEVISNTLDQVHCPSCGRGLQSLSNHRVVCNNPTREEPPNSANEEPPSFANDDARFHVGSVGNIPSSHQSEDGGFTKRGFVADDMVPWLGPLVLAAFAIVGVAVGVYSGEISLPGRMRGLSSRVVAAVDIIMQASNSITKLFAFKN